MKKDLQPLSSEHLGSYPIKDRVDGWGRKVSRTGTENELNEA